MEPFPSHSEHALKRMKRVSSSHSPQVPSLPVYVPPPKPDTSSSNVASSSAPVSALQRRSSAPSVVVVRNDVSHIFLRSRYKKLYEDLEKERKRATPSSKRVTISAGQRSLTPASAARPAEMAKLSAPPPQKKQRPDEEDEWK
jgi:hypothetical protein